jgi:putative transposase
MEHKKSFYWLRNRFVNECNIAPSCRFLLDTPKHVREGAVKDLAQAYKVNFSVKRKNPEHTFDLKFRKRKDVQSIVIPKSAFTEVKDGGGFAVYPKMLSKDPLVSFKPLHDCRLSIDRQNRFVLYVPVQVEKFAFIRKNHVDTVALDPGVRTFLTTWSPNGEAFKLGDGDSSRLYGMIVRADKLLSSISRSSGRSKWRKNRALGALRDRIENIQRDLHYQCAHFLTSKYESIVIPEFGSKRMSSKMERRLNTKTVRSMLGMGHYTFRQRLKEVAARRGIEVVECTEEYTSKTCSCCGWLHPRLGGAKVFACQECGSRVDRDLQGAFNIFLKHCKNHPEFYSG